MADPKAKPPPPTEVLSVTQREIKPGEPTSPNEEFVEQPAVEPPPESPPMGTPPQEPAEQPFQFADEPPPEEELSEEEKRVQETQRKMHEATQEVAKLKKMVDILARQQELGAMTPQAPSPAQPPPEFFNPNPLPDELSDPAYPAKYTQRQLAIQEYRRQQTDTMREMEDFIEKNPNWRELYPTMLEIRNESPYEYQTPRSLKALHRRAKERVEYQNLQTKLQEIESRATQTGANLAQTRTSRPFAAPGSSRSGSLPGKGVKTPPKEFYDGTWDADKMAEWLKEHGFYKQDQPY